MQLVHDSWTFTVVLKQIQLQNMLLGKGAVQSQITYSKDFQHKISLMLENRRRYMYLLSSSSSETPFSSDTRFRKRFCLSDGILQTVKRFREETETPLLHSADQYIHIHIHTYIHHTCIHTYIHHTCIHTHRMNHTYQTCIRISV